MKKLISLSFFLTSVLLLQGCVGAVVVGGAAVASKFATDPRSVGTQVDDSTLLLRVNNALVQDHQLSKIARINVTAYQGKILLTGQASSRDLVARAKSIVMGVDGVREVYNEIRQGKVIGFSTISSDSWITTKVRTQLFSSNLVKSRDIKIVTENSEVFLLGIVTRQEGKAAANITSRVAGVKHVVTAFTYLD